MVCISPTNKHLIVTPVVLTTCRTACEVSAYLASVKILFIYQHATRWEYSIQSCTEVACKDIWHMQQMVTYVMFRVARKLHARVLMEE